MYFTGFSIPPVSSPAVSVVVVIQNFGVVVKLVKLSLSCGTKLYQKCFSLAAGKLLGLMPDGISMYDCATLVNSGQVLVAEAELNRFARFGFL